jgi:hypothetical protein
MRSLGAILLSLGLAGCAVAPESATAPAGVVPETAKQAMEASCASAVAQHIGSDAGSVQAVWSGSTTDGRALVTVGDQVQGRQRIHFCELDDAGRVAAIRHQL